MEEQQSLLALLEVETGSHVPPLVGRLTRALFDLRVQIVRLRSRLQPPRRIEQLWIVEFDGAPIRPGRRLEIQDRVMELVDALPRGALAQDPPPAA